MRTRPPRERARRLAPGALIVAAASDTDGGLDGFSTYLTATVAIDDTGVDAAELKGMLRAVVETRGVDGYHDIRFGVVQPDRDGDTVVLDDAAKDLGVRAADGRIIDEMDEIRKAAR